MNDKETQALNALLASKKYGAICPDTVRRAFADALKKHKKVKDADKAARAALHQIAGAFLTPEEVRAAEKLPGEYAAGDKAALDKTLNLHASTRERLLFIDELYDAVFAVTGQPRRVLDLACGLNPLYLASRGIAVHGYDIHSGAVSLLNRWAEITLWPLTARTADVLGPVDYPSADLALMMKLLPVLQKQDAAAPARLLKTVPARFKLITFPTRTLGGRKVGMEQNYAAQFERLAAETGQKIARRFTLDNELCFIVEDQ